MSVAHRAMFGLLLVTWIPQQLVNPTRRQGAARNKAMLVLTCYFYKYVCSMHETLGLSHQVFLPFLSF